MTDNLIQFLVNGSNVFIVDVNGDITSAGNLTISGSINSGAITASGLITANNGINVAGGTLTIPNATASNQPVALGQFAAPVYSDNYVSSPADSTTYSTSLSFTAPSNGTILMLGFLITGSNTGIFTNSQLLMNGTVVGTGDNTASPVTEVAAETVSSGTAYTLVFQTTTPSSGSGAFDVKLAVIFIPN